MLSKKHLNDICLLGGINGKPFRQCRYLAQDDKDWGVYYCVKHKKAEKAKIDKKIAQFLQECAQNKKDPRQENCPVGNNCDGYPILKHVEQGYDKD